MPDKSCSLPSFRFPLSNPTIYQVSDLQNAIEKFAEVEANAARQLAAIEHIRKALISSEPVPSYQALYKAGLEASGASSADAIRGSFQQEISVREGRCIVQMDVQFIYSFCLLFSFLCRDLNSYVRGFFSPFFFFFFPPFFFVCVCSLESM